MLNFIFFSYRDHCCFLNLIAITETKEFDNGIAFCLKSVCE